MKARESGMPEESLWEKFFSPSYILSKLELDPSVRDVAEFGSGYGTFSIAAARIVCGKIYAFDIEPDLVHRVQSRSNDEGCSNIRVTLRDFISEGTGLPNESVDYCMLFNILHTEAPVSLLSEAYRILVPGGKAGVIHWNPDPTTPRGPPMEIRPHPYQCGQWAREAGFHLRKSLDLPPYHYGIVLEK
jgi:SAM-dependent methyltransferase